MALSKFDLIILAGVSAAIGLSLLVTVVLLICLLRHRKRAQRTRDERTQSPVPAAFGPGPAKPATTAGPKKSTLWPFSRKEQQRPTGAAAQQTKVVDLRAERERRIREGELFTMDTTENETRVAVDVSEGIFDDETMAYDATKIPIFPVDPTTMATGASIP